MANNRVFVVGAGIGGISAAYYLANHGFDVTVFDRADYVGGRMKTVQLEGFTIDVGAGILPGAYAATKALIREAGLTDMMKAVTGNCAFLRGGKTHLIDLGSMQTGLLASGLLGPRSKFLLLKPMLRTITQGRHLTFDNAGLAAHLDVETVSEYCRRELNSELHDFFFGPFVRTMYLQPPEEASVAELLWSIKNLTGAPFSLTSGMQALPERLAQSLDVRLNTTVRNIHPTPDGVSITVSDVHGSETVEHADYGLIATDAEALNGLYQDQLTSRQRDYLDSLRYSIDAVVTFCLSRETAINATLVQVPHAVDDSLAAIVIDHKKGAGRVPPGKGMVSCHFLNDWNQGMQGKSDEALLEDATRRVAKVIPEVATDLEAYHIERWPRAATMSEPGTFKRLALFMADLDPRSRIQLSGDYMALSSVNTAVTTARNAADNIIHLAAAGS